MYAEKKAIHQLPADIIPLGWKIEQFLDLCWINGDNAARHI